ncbi:hemolysin-III related [Roseimaritima ulvae]|uniref:Hemolysin-III related n=2 Tax=Roseimaritima ulvae TaxID=980254 RepID=A0A5B9QUM8_9BACT|nr:hemolysin-III related [Roseimaritima ulvae]
MDPMRDEWANTLTHAAACMVAVVGLLLMIWLVIDKPWGLQLACLSYMASVVAVFLFSTLSHAVYEPYRRARMRAWDQGTIYLMISGTYTPFAWSYGGSWQVPLLIFLWLMAGLGFASKVLFKHRVHGIGTTTYLLLGWAPALVLGPQVPLGCLAYMAAGGIIYSLGVVFLVLDQRRRFFHAVWHLFVLTAATVHYVAIVKYVVQRIMLDS